MGKFDHIPELLGSENYVGWSTKMQYALACEDLWCHINDKSDPEDLLGEPSLIPVAVDPKAPTDVEKAAMRAWLLLDMKAKDLVTRRLSTSVGALIPRAHTTTARKAWQILREHFNRTDISAQYQIRQQLQNLRMKDSADASRYVGQHAMLRDRLIDTGAPYGDADAIFNLLMGLPSASLWQQFKSQLEQRMHDDLSSPSTASSPTFTFESCMSRIAAEASRHVHVQQIQSCRPGSEYANAVVPSTVGSGSTNPITGLRKWRHNPQGVFCTTPGCNKGDHDHEHCYSKGGGMEGQAPWMRNKKKDVPAVATIALTPVPPTVSPSDVASLLDDMSFASITELPDTSSAEVACVLPHSFSTILDSGVTVTLVKDRRFFHTYSTTDVVRVCTANHGVLQTSGRGSCIGWLTIGERRVRIRLSNCLHAPEALLNLLSVSCMNAKGWDVSFRAYPSRCELAYRGIELGAIPITGKLFAVDMEFIPFVDPVPALVHEPELAAFAHVPLTLDLWHARVGHIGKHAVTRLDKIAKGVTVHSDAPLSHCELCIMAKHPRLPFHTSETERAGRFLELIHSDICGPIPVLTPHGKHYFVVFLDDHTNILDVQLLATKDQALSAWQTVRARWETMSVWDVHHPWAGKPLFSGHMRMTPMCSLCFPAFPEFRNMRPSAGDPEIDRGNSGNHRTTFGHHSYPPRTSHVIS